MIPQGNFFHPRHDKTAESAVIAVRYGSVAEFLVDHHLGPGGRNPKRELDEFNALRKRTGRALEA